MFNNTTKEYMGKIKLLNKGWYINIEYDSNIKDLITNGNLRNYSEVYFERIQNMNYPIKKTNFTL